MMMLADELEKREREREREERRHHYPTTLRDLEEVRGERIFRSHSRDKVSHSFYTSDFNQTLTLTMKKTLISLLPYFSVIGPLISIFLLNFYCYNYNTGTTFSFIVHRWMALVVSWNTASATYCINIS